MYKKSFFFFAAVLTSVTAWSQQFVDAQHVFVAGDPSKFRHTGRAWCFFTYAPDGVGVRTSKPGIDGDTFVLYLMHSDDDGNG